MVSRLQRSQQRRNMGSPHRHRARWIRQAPTFSHSQLCSHRPQGATDTTSS
jgi:hypothetical protein